MVVEPRVRCFSIPEGTLEVQEKVIVAMLVDDRLKILS